MAGHNRWSKVKHRKAVVDKRRGKALSMCSRAIISAARQHGPDPNFNHALRAAIDEARYYNVPGDNIERAIKKGAGGGEGENYEPTRYEGYGPGGVCVIVDALTNNRARTVANLRLIFEDHDCKLGQAGCVSHQFEHKGRIEVKALRSDEDRVMELALEAGADDVLNTGDEDAMFEVLCDPTKLHAVKARLVELKLTLGHASTAMIPSVNTIVTGGDVKALMDFVDALEDDEDVKKVYTNADISEAELAKLE